MCVIKTKNLKKYYGYGNNEVKAIDDINITVERGEFVSIVGTSGSGKSTLLNMLGGLDYPTSGRVTIEGEDITDMEKDELTLFRRRKIGFIFQFYNLIPELNVYENIIFPLELDGKEKDEDFFNEIIEILGLKAKLYNMPNQLSGGQQQRVAIARSLMTKPAIILADEPTGNLDTLTSNEVLKLLKETSKNFNQTVIMITHNELIANMADKIIRIEDGKVLSISTPACKGGI